MDISLVLRDIVNILPISPMPTLIMWLPWRLLVLVSPTVTKTFDENCIKLRIYDPNWLVMVTLKYCWTILMMWTPMNWSNMLSLTVWKFTDDNVAKLKLGLALDKPWQNRTRFHLNRQETVTCVSMLTTSSIAYLIVEFDYLTLNST